MLLFAFAIIQAALKAYQKDLAKNAPPKKTSKTKVSDEVESKDTNSEAKSG